MTTRSVDLFRASVPIPNSKLLQLPCHMIGCSGVEVPICVHSIGVNSIGRTVPSTTTSARRVADVVVAVAIIALSAAPSSMPLHLADLALLAVTAITAVTTTLSRRASRAAVARVVGVALATRVVVVEAAGATAVAATRAAIVAAAAATTPGRKIRGVGGGLGGDASLGGEKQREKLVEADRLLGCRARGDGGDEPIVVRLMKKTLQDVVDHIILIKRLAGGCKFVGDALHLGEVGRRRKVALAGMLEL